MLGEQAWCISFKDSACRCFGFLVSKKRYVYTIDDDCFVAKNPSNEVSTPVRRDSRRPHKGLASPPPPQPPNPLQQELSNDCATGQPMGVLIDIGDDKLLKGSM
jgi:hypothetical protein